MSIIRTISWLVLLLLVACGGEGEDENSLLPLDPPRTQVQELNPMHHKSHADGVAVCGSPLNSRATYPSTNLQSPLESALNKPNGVDQKHGANQTESEDDPKKMSNSCFHDENQCFGNQTTISWQIHGQNNASFGLTNSGALQQSDEAGPPAVDEGECSRDKATKSREGLNQYQLCIDQKRNKLEEAIYSGYAYYTEGFKENLLIAFVWTDYVALIRESYNVWARTQLNDLAGVFSNKTDTIQKCMMARQASLARRERGITDKDATPWLGKMSIYARNLRNYKNHLGPQPKACSTEQEATRLFCKAFQTGGQDLGLTNNANLYLGQEARDLCDQYYRIPKDLSDGILQSETISPVQQSHF